MGGFGRHWASGVLCAGGTSAQFRLEPERRADTTQQREVHHTRDEGKSDDPHVYERPISEVEEKGLVSAPSTS